VVFPNLPFEGKVAEDWYWTPNFWANKY